MDNLTSSVKLNNPNEVDLRRKLGIPADARRVLILAESSHWDPNWLYTSEEYYTRWVDHNLTQAMQELVHEPRRVYSVECMFFLRMFWDRHPELQDTIRQLANAGRLRMTSSGVTSADTLTPDAEAILRDLALGHKWMQDNGIQSEPRLAYFPDCFGHTPALPSLLNASGFTMTAFSRLDGMYMVGCDYEAQSAFPRPGSNAEILLKREKSLDFIWQGPDGSQVVTHWNAFTYGQGDMIAYHGVARVYLFPKFLYLSDRSDRWVKRRIHGYVAQLEPLSRTPYLFCPIGLDFVAPVPDLLPLLDQYNRRHYPETGTFVLNAGLDDYLELVNCYREKLPTLTLDPNPYWTGFYTSRPSLKKRAHELLNGLMMVEGNSLRLLPGTPAKPQAVGSKLPDLSDAWWSLATANHHDFITGTSPDRVIANDQVPMLDRAINEVGASLASMQVENGLEVSTVVQAVTSIIPVWERQGEKIRVTTPYYAVDFDQSAGGAITGAWNPNTGVKLLEGTSNELVDIRESGGLWRMGMEFKGGKFQYNESTGRQSVHLEGTPHPYGLEIYTTVSLGGNVFNCTALCRNDSPLIRFRVTGSAPAGHTIAARFHHSMEVDRLVMENPGGIVSRAVKKIYDPTFWPVHHFLHLQARDKLHGMVVMLVMPGAIACHAQDRTVEVITHRNATQEKVYGFIPILACPAAGHELEDTTFQYAICFTQTGDWQANRLPQQAREYASGPWIADLDPSLYRLIAKEVILDTEDAWVEVVKPAWMGEGIILRMWSYALPAQPVMLGLRGKEILQAWECDVRERDIRSLEVLDGKIKVALRQSITTLRLLTRQVPII